MWYYKFYSFYFFSIYLDSRDKVMTTTNVRVDIVLELSITIVISLRYLGVKDIYLWKLLYINSKSRTI